ncbi:aminoglycoside phosphotransferase family protein [Lentzea sp. BCCO 10_0061]|uniref:Aminoglycoside phosphotransferase family protein n=1 Tax=Lentzea sokolovensis TaxID=3095429 RepID=A0ABU4VB49_9PSEU|nr:aminoglycoside phosphotransferase family protein [Lentzea sp. BCCO 10_0061]MDX8148186.1 aminoglycoside phosphotransferase family protein [Lentzea sp. BCCO 10_0061]
MITVPEGFGEGLGDGAGEWVAKLPKLATKACARWQLTPDGALMNGFCAVVLPVRRADGHPAVLKLSWVDDETAQEPLALKLYNGDGAVQLLGHDEELGALLLERLDQHSLDDEPIDLAVGVIGELLRRHRGVEAPGEIRRFANTLRSHPAIPAKLLDAAREAGTRPMGTTLVNEDLHYQNVLRGDREPWLVIDPKPLSGDPEYCAIPLLWNRFDELDGHRGLTDRFLAICDAGELDVAKARDWTLHRAVANWIWCLEEDFENMAVICADIAGWAART